MAHSPFPEVAVLQRWFLAALALLALAGCANVSPARVSTDRMDYGEVIAESWKRQTLLNVVRLRYADAPVFLDVASVINSYSVAGKGNVGFTQQTRPDPNLFAIGAEGSWSNTPTVTYQPLLGDRFTRSLLQPVSPLAVFQLLQGGWSANLVFRTVVGSVNGLRNASVGIAADPAFDELIEVLSRIQRAGNIGIRVEEGKGGDGVVAVIRRAEAAPNWRRKSPRTAIAGLAEDGEFAIAYGMVPRNRNEVAMLSRSMMEIMLQLGFGIDLPTDMRHSGARCPANGIPAMQRRNHSCISAPERKRRPTPPMRRCHTGDIGTGSTTPISKASAFLPSGGFCFRSQKLARPRPRRS
jgi:hypothetical protein